MYKIIFFEDQNKNSEVLEYIQMLNCRAASTRLFGKEKVI